MAQGFVDLPKNLYSGGTFVYNPAPFTQFYLGQLARKRARDEALDQYYNNFTKSINPAGMRTQDIEGGWQQKVNDWKNYYFQNADKIKNPRLDNGQAYNQYMGRYQDLLNDTQKSKSAAQNQAQIFPVLSDPEKRTRLADATLLGIQNSNRNIYDKQYQPLDPSTIDYNPKDLTANDLKSYTTMLTDGLKMSEGSPKVVVDPNTKTKILTTVSSYNNNDLGTIASRAETLYGRSHEFKNFIDGFANPNDYADLNQTFKQHYGYDIDIKHPEELAAAWALKNTQQQVTNTSDKGFSPTNIKINVNSPEATAQGVNDYISQLRANAEPRQIKYPNGTSETTYAAQPSPELSEMFASKTGGGTVYPDQIQFKKDGSIQPIFYKTVIDKTTQKPVTKYNADGTVSIDAELSKPVSQDEFRRRVAQRLYGVSGVKALLNPNNNQQPTQNNSSGYTHITETNNGTIGVKNGKWYNVKTGKSIE
jgi:hypothetical protein